jgi:hypothetical protein
VAVDACTTRVRGQCLGTVASAGVTDAIARGTLHVSGSETQRLVDRVHAGTAGCEPLHIDLSNAAPGSVPDEASCSPFAGAFSECLDGSACAPNCSFFGCRPGTTRGSSCLFTWETIGAFQELGERCFATVSGACAPGLQCAPPCGEAYEIEGVCSPLLGEGAPCRRDDECASAFCDTAVGGSIEFAFVGVCAPPATHADGADCTRDGACTSGRCDVPIDFQNMFTYHRGTCVAAVLDGMPCRTAHDCASRDCRGTTPAPTFSCLNSGAPCNPAGMLCPIGDGCAQDVFPGACMARASPATSLIDGEACTDAALCASGSCVGGVCAPAACTARIDPTPEGGSIAVITPR